MALSTGLLERLARYDKNLVNNDRDLAQDLTTYAVKWIETETGWFLGATSTKTIYYPGGSSVLFLPQPGTVTKVEVRYGSNWQERDPTDYEVVGTEGRELILKSGESWPGSGFSFLRTPGYGGDYHVSSSTPGTSRVRVTYSAGFASADDWPADLLGVLLKVVSAEYRSRILTRARRNTEDKDTFTSALEPRDWRILREYRRQGKGVA